MVNHLIYESIVFPISTKDYCRNETNKKVFALTYFVMKMTCFILFIYQMIRKLYRFINDNR